MTRARWLALFLAAGALAVSSLSLDCKKKTDASSTASATGGSGSGGFGGFGAAVAASSSSSKAASSSSAGGGDAGPLTCMSPYTNIPKGSCDLLAQDCPVGETCFPLISNGDFSTTCSASYGLKQRGETCYTSKECEAKLFCVLGSCTPICCPDDDEPCNGGKCNVQLGEGTDNQGTQMTVQVCSYETACTIFNPGTCPPEQNGEPTYCHVSDLQNGVTQCIPSDGNVIPEGGTCGAVNDCGDMQNCLNMACRYLCSLSTWQSKMPGYGGCPSGETCSSSLSFGIPDVGGCQPLKDAG